MTLSEVMTELESHGNPQLKEIYKRHGAREPLFGVKVQDLKKILKKTKKNHELSLELYDTNNPDAMYLAGLMADETQITKAQLQQWVQQAYYSLISEYTVAWVAAETPFGFELGKEWIESDQENIASSGWATLAYYTAIKPDEELDIDFYIELLKSIPGQIHLAPNRVRYVMNGFVIALGINVPELTPLAQDIAGQIGKVKVMMGKTACKVPLATQYIEKAIDKNRLGKKRKSARC